MKTKLLMIVATFFALNIFAGQRLEPNNVSAEEVAREYLSSLRELDYESYYSSIWPQARSINELASFEAMLFWHDEVEQMIQQGFCQHFEILEDIPKDEACSPGAVAVFKDCEGKMMSVGLFLVFENGSWWVVGIDDYHPDV
jgi:hypothetical protein